MAINFAKIILILSVFVLTTLHIQQAKGQKRVILETVSEMLKLTAIALKGLTDEEIITSARERVTYDLKDPGSAVFRNERIFRSEIGIYVCGEVNAKNSYGGYIGFMPYFSDSVSSWLMTNEDSSVGSIVVLHYCLP